MDWSNSPPLPNFLAKFQPLQAKWWKMQCAERPIGSAFSGGAICKNFMFFLQGAKGFYDLLLISALFFCFFIRRSKTADLVQNLVYIILVSRFSSTLKCFMSRSCLVKFQISTSVTTVSSQDVDSIKGIRTSVAEIIERSKFELRNCCYKKNRL